MMTTTSTDSPTPAVQPCGSLTVQACLDGTIVVTRADPRIRIAAGLIDHAHPDHVRIADGVLEVWSGPDAVGPIVRYRLDTQITAGDWIAVRVDDATHPHGVPIAGTTALAGPHGTSPVRDDDDPTSTVRPSGAPRSAQTGLMRTLGGVGCHGGSTEPQTAS
jgi:hypothetical protein